MHKNGKYKMSFDEMHKKTTDTCLKTPKNKKGLKKNTTCVINEVQEKNVHVPFWQLVVPERWKKGKAIYLFKEETRT